MVFRGSRSERYLEREIVGVARNRRGVGAWGGQQMSRQSRLKSSKELIRSPELCQKVVKAFYSRELAGISVGVGKSGDLIPTSSRR